ncbi:unnamed protein product [Ceratitis capitata]|uniref:(Mediterranean fruit fly) hypothetical protein n=1 Tax=Ceratitis capitata TaxID=7213 RepID=A0A811U4L5_CERCA|nr:unnamed protein product [Ceratitis capitata]
MGRKFSERSRRFEGEIGNRSNKTGNGERSCDVNPPRSKIHQDAANRFTNQMIEQEDALFIERDFIQMSQQLRESLGLKSADVERCVDLLKQYKDFELTQLMLLRNPDCVDIIRRLRRYVGNLKEWSLSNEEENEFRAKAEIIRNEAVYIYNYFKKLFEIPTDQQFWEPFCDQVKTYKECTKHISEQNRITMSEKTYISIRSNFDKDEKYVQGKGPDPKDDVEKKSITEDNQGDDGEKPSMLFPENDGVEMDDATEGTVLESNRS